MKLLSLLRQKLTQHGIGACLALFDSARSHTSPVVIESFWANKMPAGIVPAGMTSFLQWIDVCLAAKYRVLHKDAYVRWIDTQKTASEKRRLLSIIVAASVAAASANMIAQFRSLGYLCAADFKTFVDRTREAERKQAEKQKERKPAGVPVNEMILRLKKKHEEEKMIRVTQQKMNAEVISGDETDAEEISDNFDTGSERAAVGATLLQPVPSTTPDDLFDFICGVAHNPSVPVAATPAKLARKGPNTPAKTTPVRKTPVRKTVAKEIVAFEISDTDNDNPDDNPEDDDDHDNANTF